MASSNSPQEMSLEEAFSGAPREMTVEEAFQDRPREMSLTEALSQSPDDPPDDPSLLPTPPDPQTPDEVAAERKRRETAKADPPGTVVSRLAGATGRGFVHGIGIDRPYVGIPDDIRRDLKNLGLVNDDQGAKTFFDGFMAPPRDIVEAGITTASVVAETIFRGFDAVLDTGAGLFAQTLREVGLSNDDSEVLDKQIRNTMDLAIIFAGASPSAAGQSANVGRMRATVRRNAAAASKGMPPGAKATVVNAAVKRFDEAIDNAALRSAQQKIGRPTIEDATPSSIFSFKERVITYALDAMRPIKFLQERVGANDVTAFRDMRLLAGMEGIIEAVHKRGTPFITKDGDFAFRGMGLQDALAPAGGDIKQMGLYFAGRRAHEIKRQIALGSREKIEIPFTNVEIRNMILLEKENPGLRKAFDNYQRFNREIMDFAEQAGLISAEQKARLIRMGRNYVPLYRIADDTIGRGKGGLLKRMRGGKANYAEILDNIARNTNMWLHASVTNLAKNNVYRFVEQYGLNRGAIKKSEAIKALEASGLPAKHKDELLKFFQAENYDLVNPERFAAFRKKLPLGSKAKAEINSILAKTTTKPVAFEAPATAELRKAKLIDKDLKRQLESMGIDTEEELFSILAFNRPVGDKIDFVFRNGQRKYFEIADDTFHAAMQAISPEAYQLWLSTLAVPKRVLTRGVTLSPDFIARNYVRDLQTAFVQSRGNFIPVWSTIRGTVDRIMRDDTYWEFLLNGGGFATTYKGDSILGKSLESLYTKHGFNRHSILDTPAKVARAAEEVSSAAEQANRLAEFRAVLARTGNRRDAAFAAREVSTDFAARGSGQVTRIATAVLPFFNARLQGLDRMARAFKENPVSASLKALGTVTVPSIALWFINKDDPRYRELPDWIKDQHWVVLAGDQRYLIPKGFEIGAMFGTVPERMMDLIEENNGTRFANAMGRIAYDTFAFNPVPQIARPIFDVAVNRRFGNTPIVPADLQDVRPSQQTRPWTSATLQEAAAGLSEFRGIEISPLQAEHMIRGYFGTLGLYALSAMDMVTRGATGKEGPAARIDDIMLVRSFMRADPVRNTQFQSDFYELLHHSRTAAATFAKMLKEGQNPDENDRQRRLRVLKKGLEGVADKLAKINRADRLVRLDKRLTPAQKADKLEILQRARNKITKDVMTKVPEDILREYGYQTP